MIAEGFPKTRGAQMGVVYYRAYMWLRHAHQSEADHALAYTLRNPQILLGVFPKAQNSPKASKYEPLEP